MANAGDVLDMPQLGGRVQLIRTAADTGGELLEFDGSDGPAASSSSPTCTSGRSSATRSWRAR